MTLIEMLPRLTKTDKGVLRTLLALGEVGSIMLTPGEQRGARKMLGWGLLLSRLTFNRLQYRLNLSDLQRDALQSWLETNGGT